MSKKGFLFQRTVKKNAFKKSSFCDEYSCVSVRTEENPDELESKPVTMEDNIDELNKIINIVK